MNVCINLSASKCLTVRVHACLCMCIRSHLVVGSLEDVLQLVQQQFEKLLTILCPWILNYSETVTVQHLERAGHPSCARTCSACGS